MEPEGQGRGMIMGVTVLLLLGSFATYLFTGVCNNMRNTVSATTSMYAYTTSALSNVSKVTLN